MAHLFIPADCFKHTTKTYYKGGCANLPVDRSLDRLSWQCAFVHGALGQCFKARGQLNWRPYGHNNKSLCTCFCSSHVHTVVRIRSPLIIAPMPFSSIFWMLLAWIGIERTQPGWITVELKHIRNFKTAAKGSRIANHVWTQSMHVSNFNKAYIIDKNKTQLESCRTLGTPWQPSWVSHNSSSHSVLVFSRQKFLSLFPLKFILFSFLSHYIGITVCRPRQAEHAHIQLEHQSTYNQRRHLQLRKSHYSDSTVKNTTERSCNSKNQTESNSCR